MSKGSNIITIIDREPGEIDESIEIIKEEPKTKSSNKKAKSSGGKEKPVNVHIGHRQRMKTQAMESGLRHFNDHQMLELLLFFGIPQKDTNEIAHELLNKFGSFHEVFNGSIEEIKSIKGMTENAAILIKLIPQYVAALTTKKQLGKSLSDPEDMAAFFMAQYVGVMNEQILLACLDDQLRLIELIPLATGNINRVDIEVRNIAAHALRTNASQIILAHNHPAGSSSPSDADIAATRNAIKVCKQFEIDLCEHIVIGNDGATFIVSGLYISPYGRILTKDVFENPID